MLIKVLKSKIHRARITATHLDYSGSLTIDPELMEAAGLVPYQALTFGNMSTGQRAETYAIVGKPGSREICLNGAAARLGQPGDLLVILSFGYCTAEEAGTVQPQVIVLDENNNIAEQRP